MYDMIIVQGAMNPEEFWRLGWYEFVLLCKRVEYKNKEKQWLTEEIQASVRNLYTMQYNINRKKNTAAKSPAELWPLSFDKKQKKSIDADFIEFIKRAKLLAKKNIN